MGIVSVWCVCVGEKYDDGDVHVLRAMVERHLLVPHQFICLADRQIPGVNCFIPDEVWPGWWSKLLLFRYASGQVLYLDLDVVIVGDMAPLLSDKLSMAANWAQSGHGGCQSSVMSWDSRREHYGSIADIFDLDQLLPPERGNCGAYGSKQLWGDQEFITEVMGSPGEWGVKPMRGIYSYKYHCRQSLPQDAAVVCFHGRPKPEEVHEPWITAARSYTSMAH